MSDESDTSNETNFAVSPSSSLTALSPLVANRSVPGYHVCLGPLGVEAIARVGGELGTTVH
jgi:hypothetical protein